MDKRDILHGSRNRSGAANLENIENQPPHIQNRLKGIDRPGNVEGGQKSLNFGSNVSKIKEMFQAGQSTAGKPKMAELPPTVSGVIEADRCPASKKQKMNDSPEHRHTLESKPGVEVSEPIDPKLLEATNHVQRFNYTRALFARMEAETIKSQDSPERSKSKPVSSRKSSPIRVIPRSPVLTPSSSSPTSPDARSFNVADTYGVSSQRMSRKDSSASSRSHGPPVYSPRERSNSDQSRRRSDKDFQRRTRTNSDSTNESTETQSIESPRYGSSTSSDISNHSSPRSKHLDTSSTNDNSANLRRRTLDVEHFEDGSRDRTGKFYGNLGVNNNASSSETTACTSSIKFVPKLTKPDPAPYGAERINKLNLRTNLNQNQNEASNKSDARTRQYPDSISKHSKDNDQKEGNNSVRLRNTKTQDGETNRRLSRDDIQAAMAKADAYLAHLTDSPKKKETGPEYKRRSWDPRDSSEDKYNYKRRSWDARDSQERKSLTEENLENGCNDSCTEDVIDKMDATESTKLKADLGSPRKEFIVEKIDTKNLVSTLTKPTPLPKRSAPAPPLKPPYPGNTNSSSVARPLAPPPPAPKPGLREAKKSEVSSVPSESQSWPSLLNGNEDWRNKDPPAYERSRDPPAYEDSLRDTARESETALIVENTDFQNSTQSAQPNLFERREEGEADIFSKREQGDGHEDPDLPLPLEADSDVIPYVAQDNFLEIKGLSSTDEDSSEEEIEYRKATKIRFSRHPIKMFPTYSTEDYDRRNEDVDPVAASAEYELEKRVEKMDVFPVDLIKGPEGLGLSIIGMGVGADAGLEKLGIFIKTLTEGGAAQKDGRIAVNDQIIEVDGKSLVGVTQAYAASVLRNTNGTVKFLVGREPDPSKSEVAKLIQQSLDQDRRREEIRRQEHERLQELRDEFHPKDEVLEHEHHNHIHQLQREESDRSLMEEEDAEEEKGMEDAQEKEEEEEEEEEEEDEEVEETYIDAGDATPMSAPSGMDSDSTPASSPEEMSDKPNVEVFELAESSSDTTSPDMDPQALFVKLKEAHYKNAVSEAELAKLKAKMILLENVEVQKKQNDKKIDEQSLRLRELEKALESSRKEICQYQDLLEDSQGQYIALEKQMKNDCISLEKKYYKAKKLIKDFQQREKDFIQERESLLQQQSEKDQQYNALVKSLKDRIFELEKDLTTAQTAAGLPVNLQSGNDKINKLDAIPVSKPIKPLVKTTLTEDAISPVGSVSEVSSGSEIFGSDPILTSPDVESPKTPPFVNNKSKEEFEEVPSTPLLDTTASKAKAALANSSRRPPTKRSKSTESELDGANTGVIKEETESRQESESGLETWIKHDRQESQSDTSSSVSQTSYDPHRPQFRGLDSEIPASTDVNEDSGAITLVSAKPAKGFGIPKFNMKPKQPGSTNSSTSSIVLLSNRRLDSNDSLSDSGGITLISRTPIDTGYDVTSSTSDISSSMMVSEFDEDGAKSTFTLNISGTPAAEENLSPNKRNLNQFQSCPIPDWSTEHVCHWLIALELEKYTAAFRDKNITGLQLLAIDGSKLKALGIINGKDREVLKKKVKEMKTALEKEKKQQEKERKAREKEQKKQLKKK